ncbi:SOS response-associated peptidase family protein [Alteromonas sp. C1M14]|uniref:SOS response-associated peptidase family protein n=1 Tax=Alteromonas sp. C1M14 TaxID=2841567 RepID=UPI001C08BADF|nr:SOS response-associated peptidase family protein [Alteromonas sp. C1M14]MBU2978449.1 SOS response-associated peptidase family protein [Alteromonas sp. C1M14]
MCGFIKRVTDSPAVINLLDEVGLQEVIPNFRVEQGELNFYPAFGQNPTRRIANVIISPEKTVDATWWFDCKAVGNTLEVGKRTTFNARNLDSPYWQKAVQGYRAIIVATAVGESQQMGKGSQHYLMEADKGLLIGAVYRPFANGLYSTAVITRPPHERFSDYHDKSIPCFLPHDADFVSAWLSDTKVDPVIDEVLAKPKIYQDLKVTNVKTFKNADAKGMPEYLDADVI